MYHPRNTFTPRWARIVERQSRIVGDGLTCLTFGACTIPKAFTHKRWARIVEDSPG
jgi:hypothetical protein